MTNVTREVISDLWPLYVSGDASADTRLLVEEFLARDPDFARRIREGGSGLPDTGPAPALPPDHQMKTLALIKRRLWGYPLLLQLAIMFSAVAFGRIVSDTSWDVSPRNFIVACSIALLFWIAFFVTLFRGRRAVLVRLR